MSHERAVDGRFHDRLFDSGPAAEAAGEASFSAADLLDRDEGEMPLVQLVMPSQPISVAELGEELRRTLDELALVVDRLVARGALVRGDDGLSVGNWRARRRAQGGVWSRLGDL